MSLLLILKSIVVFLKNKKMIDFFFFEKAKQFSIKGYMGKNSTHTHIHNTITPYINDIPSGQVFVKVLLCLVSSKVLSLNEMLNLFLDDLWGGFECPQLIHHLGYEQRML